MNSPAPHRRPSLVLFDVFETLVALDPLRARFVHVGRPGAELDLFFARTLRDGMAYTLAGVAPPFREVAAAELATTSGHTLSSSQIEYVLDGFAELPLQPDAIPAFELLEAADVPFYAFSHGSAGVVESVMTNAGVLGSLAGVLSAETVSAFKPPAHVYHWACARAQHEPGATALIAVHSWDTHGAQRAGLLTGFATRFEGAVPAVVDRPHVVAERLDEVVAGLLELPRP